MKIRKRCLMLIMILITSTLGLVEAKELQDLIELPAEVHDKLTQKLKQSKKYTEEQMKTITDCLEKSNIEKIINCLSDDGLEDTLEIGYMIKDEIKDLRDRVCGSSSFGDKDRCKQLQKDLLSLGHQIKETWSKTLASGQAYLKNRTELTRLKKKICDKINKKGCWSWLNERMDINCNPKKMDYEGEKLRQCRTNIARDVWEQLNAGN